MQDLSKGPGNYMIVATVIYLIVISYMREEFSVEWHTGQTVVIWLFRHMINCECGSLETTEQEPLH